MAIDFLAFPSIVDKENIKKHKLNLKDFNSNEIFYSTEKIDGTNTQIAIADNEYLIGQRRSYITDFNSPASKPWKYLLEVPHVKELINNIQSKLKINDNNKYVVRVYGEMFGKQIQSNKYNLKDYDYKVFNIIVHTKNNLSLRYVLGRKYLEELVPSELLLKIEHQGTLKDISQTLDKDSQFNIKVREGNVYTPYETYIWKKGTPFRSIKFKNDEFKEVKGKANPDKILSNNDKDLIDNIKRYVTKNRLEHILSHGYELSFKNMGILIKEMQKDIQKEYAEPINDEQQFNKIMNKYISKQIAKLITNTIKGK